MIKVSVAIQEDKIVDLVVQVTLFFVSNNLFLYKLVANPQTTIYAPKNNSSKGDMVVEKLHCSLTAD